jgi:hypothetical protein
MVDQVGGTHYKSVYQHWDWVIDVSLPYLEANATKYVSRWWKKGGVEDLKKALSYVGKLKVERISGKLSPRQKHKIHDDRSFYRFAVTNELNSQETGFCYMIMNWTDAEDIEQAEQFLLKMLADAQAGATRALPVAAGYPLGGNPMPLADKPAGGPEAMD